MLKNLRTNLRSRHGFTLVELIVGLVILGVMAAIAVPALTGYIDNGRQQSVLTEAHAAVTATQTLCSSKYQAGGFDDPAEYLRAWYGSTDATGTPTYAEEYRIYDENTPITRSQASLDAVTDADNLLHNATPDANGVITVATSNVVPGDIIDFTCDDTGMVTWLVYKSGSTTVVYSAGGSGIGAAPATPTPVPLIPIPTATPVPTATPTPPPDPSDQLRVTFYKVDSADTNTLLAGAEFSLTGPSGFTALTLTSTTTGTQQLLPVGNYTLTETKAPEGYTKATTPITFSVVDNSGTLALQGATGVNATAKTVTMENTAITRTITLYAVEEDGSTQIIGLPLRLVGYNDQIVYSGSTANSVNLKNTDAADKEYTLKFADDGGFDPSKTDYSEGSTCYNYTQCQFQFKVDENGNITAVSDTTAGTVAGNSIYLKCKRFTDKLTTLRLYKIDDKGNALKNVGFTLLNEKGGTVATLTSDKDGKLKPDTEYVDTVLEYGISYTLKETTPPTDYIPADDTQLMLIRSNYDKKLRVTDSTGAITEQTRNSIVNITNYPLSTKLALYYTGKYDAFPNRTAAFVASSATLPTGTYAPDNFTYQAPTSVSDLFGSITVRSDGTALTYNATSYAGNNFTVVSSGGYDSTKPGTYNLVLRNGDEYTSLTVKVYDYKDKEYTTTGDGKITLHYGLPWEFYAIRKQDTSEAVQLHAGNLVINEAGDYYLANNDAAVSDSIAVTVTATAGAFGKIDTTIGVVMQTAEFVSFTDGPDKWKQKVPQYSLGYDTNSKLYMANATANKNDAVNLSSMPEIPSWAWTAEAPAFVTINIKLPPENANTCNNIKYTLTDANGDTAPGGSSWNPSVNATSVDAVFALEAGTYTLDSTGLPSQLQCFPSLPYEFTVVKGESQTVTITYFSIKSSKLTLFNAVSGTELFKNTSTNIYNYAFVAAGQTPPDTDDTDYRPDSNVYFAPTVTDDNGPAGGTDGIGGWRQAILMKYDGTFLDRESCEFVSANYDPMQPGTYTINVLDTEHQYYTPLTVDIYAYLSLPNPIYTFSDGLGSVTIKPYGLEWEFFYTRSQKTATLPNSTRGTIHPGSLIYRVETNAANNTWNFGTKDSLFTKTDTFYSHFLNKSIFVLTDSAQQVWTNIVSDDRTLTETISKGQLYYSVDELKLYIATADMAIGSTYDSGKWAEIPRWAWSSDDGHNLVINTYDDLNEKPLIGVKYNLANAGGVVASWISDGTAKTFTPDTLSAGTYTLTVDTDTLPDGYETENGKDSMTVEVTNNKLTTLDLRYSPCLKAGAALPANVSTPTLTMAHITWGTANYTGLESTEWSQTDSTTRQRFRIVGPNCADTSSDGTVNIRLGQIYFLSQFKIPLDMQRLTPTGFRIIMQEDGTLVSETLKGYDKNADWSGVTLKELDQILTGGAADDLNYILDKLLIALNSHVADYAASGMPGQIIILNSADNTQFITDIKAAMQGALTAEQSARFEKLIWRFDNDGHAFNANAIVAGLRPDNDWRLMLVDKEKYPDLTYFCRRGTYNDEPASLCQYRAKSSTNTTTFTNISSTVILRGYADGWTVFSS